jgi:hypothetical protein
MQFRFSSLPPPALRRMYQRRPRVAKDLAAINALTKAMAAATTIARR